MRHCHAGPFVSSLEGHFLSFLSTCPTAPWGALPTSCILPFPYVFHLLVVVLFHKRGCDRWHEHQKRALRPIFLSFFSLFSLSSAACRFPVLCFPHFCASLVTTRWWWWWWHTPSRVLYFFHLLPRSRDGRRTAWETNAAHTTRRGIVSTHQKEGKEERWPASFAVGRRR